MSIKAKLTTFDTTMIVVSLVIGIGGFLFNAVQNIQANVPIKNVVAVFEALKEFNGPR